MILHPTPGQTVGPFFHTALPYDNGNNLVPAGRAGAIHLHGTVYDGADEPVDDALVELWQPDPYGAVIRRHGSLRRDGWTFTGWGRAATDPLGRFGFTTLPPGATSPDAAPFFAISVFARGLLNRLFTRAYLPAEAVGQKALDNDRLLGELPPERRRSMICVADADGYRFDLRLHGVGETVFLTFPGHSETIMPSRKGAS